MVQIKIKSSQINPQEIKEIKVEKFFSLGVQEKAVQQQEIEAGFKFDHVFRISTEDVDRVGDTINPKGWDCKDYNLSDPKSGEKSGPVLLFHDYNRLPIGKSYAWMEGDGLYAGIKYATEVDGYDEPKIVKQLVDGNYLKTCSVGFKATNGKATKTGMNFEKQQLLEWSIVPVPANPKAQVAMKSLGINVDQAKEVGLIAEEKEIANVDKDIALPSPILEEKTEVLGGGESGGVEKSGLNTEQLGNKEIDYKSLAESRKNTLKMYRNHMKSLRKLFELPILDDEEKNMLQLTSIIKSLIASPENQVKDNSIVENQQKRVIFRLKK